MKKKRDEGGGGGVTHPTTAARSGSFTDGEIALLVATNTIKKKYTQLLAKRQPLLREFFQKLLYAGFLSRPAPSISLWHNAPLMWYNHTLMA